jgi:hypothetical protein
MTGLKLRLADGSEIEATIESSIGGGLRDLLASGYAGNQMRIASDDTDDVEGHGISDTLSVRLFDEDDTEGQAMTLRLPSSAAARDLQRKLLTAGVVGVIVVGAATTAVVVSQQPSQTATGAGAQTVPAAAPAPWYANPAARDRGADAVSAPLVAPLSANPAARDRGAEDGIAPSVAAPGTVQAPVDAQSPGYGSSVVPGAAEGIYPATTTPIAAPDSANPANRDRGGDATVTDESGNQAAPGESRLR